MFTDTANSVSRFLYRRAIGLFILRFTTGLIFIIHGVMKLGNIDMVAGFLGHFGLAPAIAWAWFIALLEVVGGAALILGVATRLFGLLFAIEMIVAVLLTGVGSGIGPHEFELLLATSSIAIALIGSGRASMFAMECTNCGGMFCDGNVCVEEDVEA